MIPESRSGQLSAFWKLLGSYEDATIQEAVSLNDKDFPRLDRLNEYKKDALQRLEQLGERCGLDRRNIELRARLEALEQAEALNLEAAQNMVALMRRESDGILLAQRRLSSLRSAYAGDAPVHEFFAEG